MLTATILKQFCAFTLVLTLATGCATVSASRMLPAYPTQDQSPEQQAQDKAECDAWAIEQAHLDPAGSAAVGAGVGGLLGAGLAAGRGAVTGAFLGHAGTGAAIGAAIGGLAGSAEGALRGARAQRMYTLSAYKACIAGHGYTTP